MSEQIQMSPGFEGRAAIVKRASAYVEQTKVKYGNESHYPPEIETMIDLMGLIKSLELALAMEQELARENRAFERGVERGKFEESMRRGEAEVATNCANWVDGSCNNCGTQSQGFQVSAEYKCPHFTRGQPQ